MTRDKEKRNNCLNRAGFDKLRVVLSDLSSIKNKTGGGGSKSAKGGPYPLADLVRGVHIR